MTIVIQGHACDDLTGTHGGGYAIVMWEIMVPKKTLAATSSMIILTGTFLKWRVYQTDLNLSLMVRIQRSMTSSCSSLDVVLTAIPELSTSALIGSN